MVGESVKTVPYPIPELLLLRGFCLPSGLGLTGVRQACIAERYKSYLFDR